MEVLSKKILQESTIKFTVILVVVANIAINNKLFAEQIEDKEGRVIEAEIIQLKPKSVKIKRYYDRRTFEVPLDSLSEKTVKMLQDNKDKYRVFSEKIEIDFRQRKKDKLDDNLDYDDRKQKITPVITITNLHNNLNTDQLKVTVILFGKGAKEGESKLTSIIANKDYKINEPLEPLEPFEKQEIVGDTIENSYGDNFEARFGFKYFAYGVFAHNASNRKLIKKKINSARYRKIKPEVLLKLKVRGVYDQDFKFVRKRLR